MFKKTKCVIINTAKEPEEVIVEDKWEKYLHVIVTQ